MSSNPYPFITVTGADELCDIDELLGLDAEIGVLFSTAPITSPRYPRWQWIEAVSARLPRTALHVCGLGARTQLLEQSLNVEGFRRIQVNGFLIPEHVEAICSLYPNHEIITQHNHRNRELIDIPASNHSLLVDNSGGRGVSPEVWRRPDTTKPVGFAGGLGPVNLSEELDRIEPMAGSCWWVDMEGQLRIDDLFSTERAARCVELFHQALAGL